MRSRVLTLTSNAKGRRSGANTMTRQRTSSWNDTERITEKHSIIGSNIMTKRQYVSHIKELMESDAKRLQFNFVTEQEAYFCLKNIRAFLDRSGTDLSVWRVKKTVYVEKI